MKIQRVTPMQRWRQLQNAEMATIKEITFHAKQIQKQTGCTWGEAIRVAEGRRRGEVSPSQWSQEAGVE